MKQKILLWCYGLVGGCIGGGATAVTSWFGMTGAKAIGIDVPPLNLKAMYVIFLSGVIWSGMAFLAKSPLPPLNGTTQFFTRPKTPVDKDGHDGKDGA